jgi:hypothetical protein
MSQADDRFAIIRVLDRYAEVLDARDWDGDRTYKLHSGITSKPGRYVKYPGVAP